MKKENFAIWRYREAIRNLVFKDMKTSYCNTLMGLLWSLLSPLVTILLYWFVFGVMLNVGRDNYALYLITGILPWNYFSIAVMMASTNIVDQGNLIKKIYFPRFILPLSLAIFQFALFLISLLVFFPLISFLHAKVTLAFLLFPMIFILQFIFTVGITSIIATGTVFFRDLKQIVDLSILILFWLTPVVYDFQQVTDMRWLMYVNPAASYSIAYHDILCFGKFPDLWILGYCFMWAAVFWTIGWGITTHLESKFTLEL